MSRARNVGWAHSTSGKSLLDDVEQLIASVATPAIDHAGISAAAIDGLPVGVMTNGFSMQGFQGALVAMGNEGLAHVPAVRLEKCGAAVAKDVSILERVR
nr:acetyl-CoA acetyltransferase [Rhizobium sp. Khangiran2]